MTELDRYLEAATRQNTQRSYASALRHFEVEWGGHLPATPDSVARYLAEQGPRAAINTLKQRLAALAHWHTEHGFVDPTRAPLVRKVLKGIQTLHPRIEKQVTPLQLTQLTQVTEWLDAAVLAARARSDRASELRHLRDKAFVLLGFWRGFRGDELIRVQVEHLQATVCAQLLVGLEITKTVDVNLTIHRPPAVTQFTQGTHAQTGKCQHPSGLEHAMRFA